MKKTQEELGSVHLKIEGLDKEKFKTLIKNHTLGSNVNIEKLFLEEGCYVENYYSHRERWCWVITYNLEITSKEISIGELEEMLVGKVERTPEVLEAEIKLLQQELAELVKVKIGDVVITNHNIIGVIDEIDEATILPFSVGNIWYQHVTKIDPNKTVKEILGL